MHTLGRLCVCSTASLQGAHWRCCVHVGWLRRVRVMRAGIEAPKSCWWVQRLFNMSTITREWGALQHAHLMPFRWAGGAPDKGGGCLCEGMSSTPLVCSAGSRWAVHACCLLGESVIPTLCWAINASGSRPVTCCTSPQHSEPAVVCGCWLQGHVATRAAHAAAQHQVNGHSSRHAGGCGAGVQRFTGMHTCGRGLAPVAAPCTRTVLSAHGAQHEAMWPRLRPRPRPDAVWVGWEWGQSVAAAPADGRAACWAGWHSTGAHPRASWDRWVQAPGWQQTAHCRVSQGGILGLCLCSAGTLGCGRLVGSCAVLSSSACVLSQPLFVAAGKTRTILNLLSVVMHSAAKGSLELVPSVAKLASSAAAVATGSSGGDGGSMPDAAAERQRLWQQQSPWMFGQPTVRDLVGPTASTGKEGGPVEEDSQIESSCATSKSKDCHCWFSIPRFLCVHTMVWLLAPTSMVLCAVQACPAMTQSALAS